MPKMSLSILYFRDNNKFCLCSWMLLMSDQSVVVSSICFAVVCWGTFIKAKDAIRLYILLKKAGSVVGSWLATLEEVVEQKMDNISHSLHDRVNLLRSSFTNGMIQPLCYKEQDRMSFLQCAISIFHTSVIWELTCFTSSSCTKLFMDGGEILSPFSLRACGQYLQIIVSEESAGTVSQVYSNTKLL